jgi:hypothetical protein
MKTYEGNAATQSITGEITRRDNLALQIFYFFTIMNCCRCWIFLKQTFLQLSWRIVFCWRQTT